MVNRKSDSCNQSVYRSERFFLHSGMWYFYTREGTQEGPFIAREEAEQRLERYIRVMSTGLLSQDNALSVLPLE